MLGIRRVWIRAQNLPPGPGPWASPSFPQWQEKKPPAVSGEVTDLEKSTSEPCADRRLPVSQRVPQPGLRDLVLARLASISPLQHL